MPHAFNIKSVNLIRILLGIKYDFPTFYQNFLIFFVSYFSKEIFSDLVPYFDVHHSGKLMHLVVELESMAKCKITVLLEIFGLDIILLFIIEFITLSRNVIPPHKGQTKRLFPWNNNMIFFLSQVLKINAKNSV